MPELGDLHTQSAAEKELAEICELFSSKQYSNNVQTMAPSSVCPPPPPPMPSLISGDPYPLTITKQKESSTPNSQTHRIPITVEALRSAQLKKTPSNTPQVSCPSKKILDHSYRKIAFTLLTIISLIHK